MIFVTLVEDDPVAADLLKDYLSGEELKINCHYTSAEAALERIPTLPLPDIILMDINLPGVSGIEATQQLKQQFPDVDIVMMTTFEDSKSILGAIKAGASGYLLKASSSGEIRDALQEIHRGGSFLSGRIARKVLDEFRSDLVVQDVPVQNYQVKELSVREQEILDRLVQGDSYKNIAEACNISVHTVNNHIRKIYEKMQVHSRSEAVAKAMGVG